MQHDVCHHHCVVKTSVFRFTEYPEVPGDRSKLVVLQSWKTTSCNVHRIELRIGNLQAHPPGVRQQKAHVKADVVRGNRKIAEEIQKIRKNTFHRIGETDHFVRDARKSCDIRRDSAAWIDELLPGCRDSAILDLDGTNFYNLAV